MKFYVVFVLFMVSSISTIQLLGLLNLGLLNQLSCSLFCRAYIYIIALCFVSKTHSNV